MTTDPVIAVIGAGALGRRHLQAVLALPGAKRFVVIDPVEASLDAARAAVGQFGPKDRDIAVSYHSAIEAGLPALDLAIVATSANARMAVLKQLLDTTRVRNLVLEKILFQDPAEYPVAAKLLAEAGARAWVNTPRRAMPPHQRIRAFFDGHAIRRFDAFGGEWGLGTSTVHLLDFLAFIGGFGAELDSTATFSGESQESKRPGFMELTGTLTGRMNTAGFSLTAEKGSTARLMMTIRSDTRTVLLDEGSGTAFLLDQEDGDWVQDSFTLPFVSQTTTWIADAILNDGTVPLPDFSESSAIHLATLRPYAEFFRANGQMPTGAVPLT